MPKTSSTNKSHGEFITPNNCFTPKAELEAASSSPWRLADCLKQLRTQIDNMAPGRLKVSDGSIGDAKHASRTSDHNPWVLDGDYGVVTAIDITNDTKNGCSAKEIVEALVSSRDSRIKYIIYNKKIVSSQQSPWVWRYYKGANPHTKHFHISVLPAKGKYDSKAQWIIK